MITAKNQKLSDRIQKARGCQRSSARVYSSNLNRVHRDFLPTTKYSQDLKWLVNNTKPLLVKLKRIENVNTQRNMLSAVLVGLDLLGATKAKEPFAKAVGVLNRMKEETSRDGNLTAKQESKFVEWKSIMKLRRLLARVVNLGQYYKRKKIGRTMFQSIQENLVLHLYTEIPPVRNDWSTVRYLTEKEWDDLPESEKTSTNNLVLGRGGYRVYWADYKTVKKHGVIQQIIPPALQKLLKKHIKFLRVHYPDNRHLLLTTIATPMSRNGLTKFLQKLFYKHFHKKVSTSALRSIFLSHKFNKKQLEDQRTVARAMHHTPEVARDFYVKNLPSK